MTKTLQNKTALVIGGSRNIGRETALALAEQGADIIFTYKQNAAAASATAGEIEAKGARVAAICVDLTGTAELDG